jgi:hypothetical protein
MAYYFKQILAPFYTIYLIFYYYTIENPIMQALKKPPSQPETDGRLRYRLLQKIQFPVLALSTILFFAQKPPPLELFVHL